MPSSPFDDGELYDVLFRDIAYGVDYYRNLAVAAAGPVLDIACGTGRILLPCLQAGADVDGVDLAEGMLARLRVRAAEVGLSPHLTVADMSDFRLTRRYALIMITFNAFIHNLTQADQIRCLTRCREHLLPGGLLTFDTFFPGWAIVGAPPGTRELELETTDPRTGKILRLYDTRTFDRVAQTQHSLNEVEFVDAAGQVTAVHTSEFTTRYVYREEMKLLLAAAGFERYEIWGDFTDRPLLQESDVMIVRAWV